MIKVHFLCKFYSFKLFTNLKVLMSQNRLLRCRPKAKKVLLCGSLSVVGSCGQVTQCWPLTLGQPHLVTGNIWRHLVFGTICRDVVIHGGGAKCSREQIVALKTPLGKDAVAVVKPRLQQCFAYQDVKSMKDLVALNMTSLCTTM